MSNKKLKASKPNKDNQLSLPQAKKLLFTDKEELINLGLTNKEIKFIASYTTNGFNKGKAYIEAGFTVKYEKNAPMQADKLLQKDKIQKALQLFFDLAINPIRAKLEYLVLELMYNRVFYKISDFYRTNDWGEPEIIPIEDLPENLQVCIDGVEVSFHGKDAQAKTVRYKLPDRDRATKVLLQYIEEHRKNHKSIQDNGLKKKVDQIMESFNEKKASNSEILRFHV